MVQDEGESGQQGRRLGAGRELVGQHDQVVHQPRVGHGGQAAAYLRTQQPPRIRLALDLVPGALEVPPAGQLPQPGQLVGHVGAGEVGPADDPRDQLVLVGERQEFRGLLGDGDGLDEDGAVDARRAGLGCEILHGEVAPDRVALGDPVLVPHGQVPDVVVRVDHGHDGSSQTTGRPASAPSPE
ncbi:uncharacterized protein SAZU_7657 [Streptomyces azureus]|uniref:Uncharacterized protein n=1 Tax=Streptomyces azureus TaxID=146537 RepID=A0A0K8PYH1_STRAJ|nr:uncharacterized protein SAZU_7657 [Streptomyces azureus]